MQEESVSSLSVSIVCYGTPLPELCELLVSLAAANPSTQQARILVYLIDNSDDEGLSLEELSHILPEVVAEKIELRLIQGHGNVGFGAGHNLVLPALDSKFHLVLNPDVIVDDKCLSAGLEFMEANGDVAVSSPCARYADSSKQYLCKQYPSVLTFIIRGFLPQPLRTLFAKRLGKYEMHSLSESEPTKGIPIVSGCFMLCKTSALQELGGFDQRYFLYFEDFDLCLRIAELGSIAYVPAMHIQHAGGHAARKGRAHLGMFARSGFRFFSTHGWRFFGQSG